MPSQSLYRSLEALHANCFPYFLIFLLFIPLISLQYTSLHPIYVLST
jgi:hypothetical protein